MAKRHGKKKAKAKEIITVPLDGRLIIQAPKGATSEMVDDLIKNVDLLRAGATKTLIIPYNYKVYELQMEEPKMDEKKKIVNEDTMENAKQKVNDSKKEVVNDD